MKRYRWMWVLLRAKSKHAGSVGTFYFILFAGAGRATMLGHTLGASRRKTDLGKSTLLFHLQRKGRTIGLPLIRNRLACLVGWLVGWLQLREMLF